MVWPVTNFTTGRPGILYLAPTCIGQAGYNGVMVSQTHQANYILPSARHCVKKKIIKLFSHYVTSSRQYFHLNKELYEAMQIETLLQVSPHGNSP